MSKPISGKSIEDDIELKLPVNPAYVSAARLTASSVANRMGFNIEDIEDIKAAVSEACTYLIKKKQVVTDSETYKIVFSLSSTKLSIHLWMQSSNISQDPDMETENELGILMLQSLMDELEFNEENGQIHISMQKHLG